MSTLADTQLPDVSTWLRVIDWVRDLVANLEDRYNMIFVDANPSLIVKNRVKSLISWSAGARSRLSSSAHPAAVTFSM